MLLAKILGLHGHHTTAWGKLIRHGVTIVTQCSGRKSKLHDVKFQSDPLPDFQLIQPCNNAG
jgi:hypothetical protein